MSLKNLIRQLAVLVLLVIFSPFTTAESLLETRLNEWKKEVALRLFKVMHDRQKDTDYTYTALAENIGMSKAAISKIKSGLTPLNVDVGRAIAGELKIMPEWLLAYPMLQEIFRDVPVSEIELPTPFIRMGRTIKMALESKVLARSPFERECSDLLDGIATEDLIKALNRRGYSVVRDLDAN